MSDTLFIVCVKLSLTFQMKFLDFLRKQSVIPPFHHLLDTILESLYASTELFTEQKNYIASFCNECA